MCCTVENNDMTNEGGSICKKKNLERTLVNSLGEETNREALKPRNFPRISKQQEVKTIFQTPWTQLSSQ